MKKILSKEEKVCVWLELASGISLKKKLYLIEEFGSPSKLYDEFLNFKDEIVKLIDIENYNKLKLLRDDAVIEKFMDDLSDYNVDFITLYSNEMPDSIKNMYNPPLLLYYKGDITLLKSFCFCIIGTRHCTHYGAETSFNFSKALVRNGWTVVSGLTAGIDTKAHEGALACDGKTIAICAGGLASVYPVENTLLFKKIIENGLVISEYYPTVQYLSYNFPQRNRLFAGLCEGVLIVEANEKSGTMITKEYAFEENKDVFCVPGNINSSASKGTNALIKSQEAYLVMSPEDILVHFNKIPLKIVDKMPQIKLEFIEEGILSLIENEALEFDDIMKKLDVSTKDLITTLTKMEIKGYITKLAGNKYIKRKST